MKYDAGRDLLDFARISAERPSAVQSDTFPARLTWQDAWAIDQLFPEASATWDAHVTRLPHAWSTDIAIVVMRHRRFAITDGASGGRYVAGDLTLDVVGCSVRWQTWHSLGDKDDDPGFWIEHKRNVTARYAPARGNRSPTWVTIR